MQTITYPAVDGYELLEPIRNGQATFRARRVGGDVLATNEFVVKILQPSQGHFLPSPYSRLHTTVENLIEADVSIVPLLETTKTHDGQVAIITPYYPDGNLTEKIESGGISSEAAIDVIVPVVEIVAKAHRSGLVLANLSPDIVVYEKQVPAIALYGSRSPRGETGASYRSPETGRTPLDTLTPTADVYSLAAMLGALIAGHPKGNATAGDFLSELQTIGCQAEVVEVIKKAMAHTITSRYRNATDFLVALARCQSPKTVPDVPKPPASNPDASAGGPQLQPLIMDDRRRAVADQSGAPISQPLPGQLPPLNADSMGQLPPLSPNGFDDRPPGQLPSLGLDDNPRPSGQLPPLGFDDNPRPSGQLPPLGLDDNPRPSGQLPSLGFDDNPRPSGQFPPPGPDDHLSPSQPSPSPLWGEGHNHGPSSQPPAPVGLDHYNHGPSSQPPAPVGLDHLHNHSTPSQLPPSAPGFTDPNNGLWGQVPPRVFPTASDPGQGPTVIDGGVFGPITIGVMSAQSQTHQSTSSAQDLATTTIRISSPMPPSPGWGPESSSPNLMSRPGPLSDLEFLVDGADSYKAPPVVEDSPPKASRLAQFRTPENRRRALEDQSMAFQPAQSPDKNMFDRPRSLETRVRNDLPGEPGGIGNLHTVWYNHRRNLIPAAAALILVGVLGYSILNANREPEATTPAGQNSATTVDVEGQGLIVDGGVNATSSAVEVASGAGS